MFKNDFIFIFILIFYCIYKTNKFSKIINVLFHYFTQLKLIYHFSNIKKKILTINKFNIIY